MTCNSLGVHETLELHELIVFKNVCGTKSSAMQNLVQDDAVKAILQQDVEMTTKHLKELQALIQPQATL